MTKEYKNEPRSGYRETEYGSSDSRSPGNDTRRNNNNKNRSSGGGNEEMVYRKKK